MSDSESPELDAFRNRGHLNDTDAAHFSHCKVHIQLSGAGHPCGPFTLADPGPRLLAEADGDLCRYLLDLAFASLDRESLRSGGDSDLAHNDSSTGDHPAATGLTDRVGVAARRGDDSSPDGHANSTARIIRQLAELQRSVLDVLSWWDIVHGDPASDAAEGFLADAIAALRKEVRR